MYFILVHGQCSNVEQKPSTNEFQTGSLTLHRYLYIKVRQFSPLASSCIVTGRKAALSTISFGVNQMRMLYIDGTFVPGLYNAFCVGVSLHIVVSPYCPPAPVGGLRESRGLKEFFTENWELV